MKRRHSAINYHQFRTLEAHIGGRAYRFVSKPGLPAWDKLDSDTRLLAESVQLLPNQKILCIGPKCGLLGVAVVDRLPDAELWLLDSNVIAVRAAQRTLALHGLSQANVLISDAMWEVRDQRFDQVLVDLPKGKALAQQLIVDAFHVLRQGGSLLLAGGNQEGIKSHAKTVKRVFGHARVVRFGGRHRVILAVRQTQDIHDQAARDLGSDYYNYIQFQVTIRDRSYQVVSKPGVFSWDRLDAGTYLLLEHLVVNSADIVLDLGTGCGIIGAVAAVQAPQGYAYLVDAYIAAVNASRYTLEANDIHNASALLSDVASDVRGISFDLVVTNPPFHLGVESEYQVAAQFIMDAHAVLKIGGRLCLVANRFLKYERQIAEEFGNCRTVYSDSRYKILEATKRG